MSYQTDTREAPCGTRYRVDWEYDGDHRAPHKESDGHGVVVELADDPADYPGYVYDDYEPDMEEVIRHKMMRRLSQDAHYRKGYVKYYDVWETRKKAKAEGWGVANPTGLSPDEIIDAAIEADFTYLRGWYNDDWHWCTITVTLLAEAEDDDDEDMEWDSYLGGVCSDDDEHHQEVITELLADALGRKAKEATTVITEETT